MEDEFALDLSKTYIYEGNEYILTGRSAKKDPDISPPRRRRRRSRVESSDEIDMMVEIKPAPRKAVRGAMVSPTMTKELQWVKRSELYTVDDALEGDSLEDEDESTDSSC